MAIAGAPSAHAQMAVYDAANHAETSQTLAQTIKILDETKQQVDQLTSVASTLGAFGSSSSAGVLSSSLRTVNASMSIPPMNFDNWNLPSSMPTPNLGSFGSARDFVGQALGVTPDKNKTLAYGDFDAAQRRRALAFRDAAWNGYAIALQQRQTIAPALERVAGLSDQADAAPTVIEEIRASNKLLAAIAGELVAQRAVMTAYLEIASSQAIATAPVIFTDSSATAAGLRSSSNGPLGN
jgi:hypothetical protein